MKHVHAYETLSHYGISSELMELGIQSGEMRRCSECRKEMPFVRIKKGGWIPLFDDRQGDEQDILLA